MFYRCLCCILMQMCIFASSFECMVVYFAFFFYLCFRFIFCVFFLWTFQQRTMCNLYILWIPLLCYLKNVFYYLFGNMFFILNCILLCFILAIFYESLFCVKIYASCDNLFYYLLKDIIIVKKHILEASKYIIM